MMAASCNSSSRHLERDGAPGAAAAHGFGIRATKLHTYMNASI